MLEVRVPQLVTQSPNTPIFHWSQRHRKIKLEREAVRLMLSQVRSRPEFPLIVTLVRESPRQFDDDNLAASFKGPRDEIADWLGLPNDRDPRVTWRYDQQKVPRKRSGTLIRLESR